jgi:predicted RNA binding protein YcfA (HicA-like mRNA interferase family)
MLARRGFFNSEQLFARQGPTCGNRSGMGEWDFSRLMPTRYTSRELVKLAEEFGWRLVGVRGDHNNFKHPASRFIVTIVHPQKDVPASGGYGEENQTGG